MSHPEITHILDPDDSDAAVVGQVLGARGDVNYEESGSIQLPSGILEVPVTFLWEKETADYRFEYCYVEDSNSPPEDIRAVVNSRSTTGFTVQLSAAPDTNESVLRWRVITPDGLHLTQPPTSQPRYVLAGEFQSLSENLTALSGLVLTGYGSGLLELVDEEAVRDYIGAIATGESQPLNAQLTLLSLLPVQAFGLGALNMANAEDFLAYIGADEGGPGGPFVPTTRTLSEGAGLAGNTYDLSANRTLAMGTPSTLAVSSTNSVSGTTHNHAISSSSNPGAAASILATNALGQLALIDLLASATTFNLINTTATTINFAGAATALGIGWSASGVTTLKSPTVSLSGTLFNPVTTYNTDIGQISKKFKSIHAAELWVETLVAQDTLATIGGRILVGPTTSLIADLAAAGTTVDVKHNNLASGDRIYMESGGKVEFMAVTSSATSITGGYRYTVTRNLDGTSPNDWFAGDAIFNTGTTGSGFIDLYSLRGVKSASEAGPTIVGNVRNSSAYNDWSAHWAIGNLKGLYDYGADTYGAAFGRYGVANKTWIAVDDANGIRIGNNTTTLGEWDITGRVFIGQTGAGNTYLNIDSADGIRIRNGAAAVLAQWDPSGNILVGQTASNQGNVFISSAGTISIRRGTTDYITLGATDAQFTNLIKMSGANAAISLGTTPPTSATVGTGLWMDRTGLYSLSSNTQNVVFDSTGVTAASGKIRLNNTGLSFDSSSATSDRAITWTNSGVTTGSVENFMAGASSTATLLATNTSTGMTGNSSLRAKNDDNSGDVLISAIAYGSTFGAGVSGKTKATITGSNFQGLTVGANTMPTHMLDVYGTGWFQGLVVIGGSTPASAGAAGEAGTVTWDTNFLYACVATNTWKRSALSTW